MHNYPLLRRVSELYEEVELGNVLLLACQHLLAPQKEMFERLLELGLKPENCVIVGKNYSTNIKVMEELKALGCIVAPFSNEFAPLLSFDKWFEEKLTAFVESEISRRSMATYNKVIILDDGGFMHIIADRLCGNLTNVIGIEQTSSGHHKINAAGIGFLSISVARSYQKLMFESPYIGINGHMRIMHSLKKAGKTNPNILVIGLGHIGRQTAGQLFCKEKFRGIAADPQLQNLRTAHIGLKGVFDLIPKDQMISSQVATECLQEFDVVIGTTGSPAITESDIRHLHKETMLISMSSSDREFPAVQFRHQKGLVHEDYSLGNMTLVNGGFPITFDGASDAMPPQQIEFTISLLMIRVLDAINKSLQHLPSVVEQIRLMWRPDAGTDEWYGEFNSRLS